MNPHEAVDVYERSLKHIDDEGKGLLAISIYALRKRIPMKPYDGEDCPSCYTLVTDEYASDGDRTSYCPGCGQAIDWSWG